MLETLGTIDELNSIIGFMVSLRIDRKDVEDCFTRIQNDLFNLGGELYLPERIAITPEKVSYLEQQLDTWNQTLPPLQEFLLPRGACHMARTICRRVERCVVRLHRKRTLANLEILRYINRLSDLLFVASRILAQENGKPELMWEKPSDI